MRKEVRMKILIGLGIVTVIMSIVSFFLMRYDKKCAIEHKRRVPEKTLFLVAGLFGAIGGTIGMYVFRHKTNHWYFKTFFPTMMIIQIAILGILAMRAMK